MQEDNEYGENTMTEKEKMLAEQLYDPNDPELSVLRQTGHHLCKVYNETEETSLKERREILDQLLEQL